MSTVVTPDDIQTYLELGEVNVSRAQMLIDDAITDALSIVTVGTIPLTGATEVNLPAGAASVIRAAVARIYLNPQGVSAEGTGPFNFTRSTVSGAMFSKAERQKLRRLAKQGGGAFTVDPIAALTLDDFRDPLAQPTDQEQLEYLEETGIE